jgi:hypothetical protein
MTDAVESDGKLGEDEDIVLSALAKAPEQDPVAHDVSSKNAKDEVPNKSQLTDQTHFLPPRTVIQCVSSLADTFIVLTTHTGSLLDSIYWFC